MADRNAIKADAVTVLDFLSPLNLAAMDGSVVEAVKLNNSTGFDGSLKKALCVPFTKIAIKHGKGKSRIISQAETGALKTISGAIDLTTAAADGLAFDGE